LSDPFARPSIPPVPPPVPTPVPVPPGSAPSLGRQGLRFRVYLLTAVGVLVPSVLVGSISWWHLSKLDNELLAARRGAAVAVAEHLDEELTGDLEDLQRVASAKEVTSGLQDLEAVRAQLRTTYLHSQLVGGLFVLDGSGAVLVEEPRSSRRIAPAADVPDVQAALRDGKPRITSLVGSGDEARNYALLPVVDWRGKPIALIGGVVDPTQPLRARVLRHLERGGGHASIVDANGVVLASSDRARQRETVQCRVRTTGLIRNRETAIGLCRDCHASGVPWMMAVAPLSSAPWAVTILQPEETVLATSRGIPAKLLTVALGLLVVAGAFAFGIVRSVTRPIAVLTAASERIAAGAMDEGIPALGDDELGRLGRSVERMRASLREMIAYVARANEQLEHRVGERTQELARANEALRERDAQRQRLLRMVITAQEDERKRIARELHDETTQSLAVLTMGIETASNAIRAGGPTPRLDEVKALAVRTLEEVHRLILDLRPAVLDDLGLFSALRWYADRYLASRGIAVRCEIAELDRRLPPEVEIALFRIGQEAMNNIVRHAKAESVLIQLGHDGRDLRIEIEDDGQGFTVGVTPADRPHYGIMGIRERAEALGGTAVIDSSPGRGTRIEVRVPLPDGSAAGDERAGEGRAPGAGVADVASPLARPRISSEPT
jgi:signal transduction histidine kinase